MSDGWQQEPWAIRLPGDEATRKAGDNLRQWAGDERGRVRRLFDRVAFRDLADPKLAGARGEEAVGKELARLGGGWTVLHGVRIGPQADVDHLAIGPAGVFTMKTKRLASRAKVVVSARQLRVNGYGRDYYPRVVKEAERVAARLTAAAGTPVGVRPVLVITGVDRRSYRVEAQPDDVAVVAHRALRSWLTAQPQALPPQTVALLANKARQPATWDASKAAQALDGPPASRTAADAPLVIALDPPPPRDGSRSCAGAATATTGCTSMTR